MTERGVGVTRVARRLAFGVAAAAAAAVLVAPVAVATPEGDAADAINQAWDAAGGVGSSIGAPDGDVFEVGPGYGRKFSGGKIFFTPETGAHLIYGAILDKYESLGGPADSDLGFPTIDEVPGLIGPDSRVSTFSASDKPAVFWTPETGAWAVRGAINAAWDKLGGSAGTLGVPIEDERYDGDVVSQKFTGGELSWNSATKTFTTVPTELVENLLGLDVPQDATTLINLAWRATGGLGGPLGARQGEQSPIGDSGAAQGYAGGKIFYSPDTGAHALTGAILAKYESLGGPSGDLGLPAGPEADGGVPNSRISSFSAPDRPAIFWTPDSGAIVVRGAVNAAWQKLGGAAGTLGVPTGEQSASGDTVTQKFSGGQISWNTATKEFTTTPTALAADLKGLELPEAVSQTPAGTAAGGSSDNGSAVQWWWLAIILPLVLLAGLLVARSRRRSATALDRGGDRYEGARENGYDAGLRPESGERRWPADDESGEFGARWSASGSGVSDFDADEDAIDTAPTRVPSDAELAQFGGEDDEDSDTGRHAADGPGGLAPVWQLDAPDPDRPRRRHAADEPAEWADYPGQRFAADFEERVEERFEERIELPREAGDEVPREIRFESYFEERSESEADHGARAEQAEFTGAVGSEASGLTDDEPWRPAIHLPLADPYQPPEGYYIKANTHSGLYYTPESVLYDNTVPEVWFASEEVAQSNGFVRAPE